MSAAGDPQHPKIVLHYAIQTALRHDAIVPGIEPEATLTRWTLIAELILPANRKALITATSTIDGTDLHSWESQGFYLTALRRAMREHQ